MVAASGVSGRSRPTWGLPMNVSVLDSMIGNIARTDCLRKVKGMTQTILGVLRPPLEASTFGVAMKTALSEDCWSPF